MARTDLEMERQLARESARERIEQTVKAFEYMAQDMRRYLASFDECSNDRERAQQLSFLIHRAVQQPNYRIDLLAGSQAELLVLFNKE